MVNVHILGFSSRGNSPCNNNPDELKIDKIKRMYKANKFKTEIIQIPHFEPNVG